MLRNAGQPIGAEDSCVEARADWASGLRGYLTWGVPIAILLATPLVGERSPVIVWPALLTFMGVACWLNARRCGRIHCYVTGPFFLMLAGLALLHGMGMLPLGAHGWPTLSAVLIIGTVTLIWVPEWLLGRYRSSRKSVCPP
jgi:hypothetical protein